MGKGYTPKNSQGYDSRSKEILRLNEEVKQLGEYALEVEDRLKNLKKTPKARRNEKWERDFERYNNESSIAYQLLSDATKRLEKEKQESRADVERRSRAIDETRRSRK